MTFYVYYNNAGSNANWNKVYGITGITDASWHHIVAVCNQTEGYMGLYYDGVSVGSQGGSPPGTNSILNDNYLYLGRTYNANNYTGSLDDVAIFSRALNTQEALDIYRASLPSMSVVVGAGGAGNVYNGLS